MSEEQEAIAIIAKAIETARLDFPEHPYGGRWDQSKVDPADAQLFARAAVAALKNGGFQIAKPAPEKTVTPKQ